MSRIARILLAGFLALLPILVTIFVTAWIVGLVHDWIGLKSGFGKFLISLGLNLSASTTAAYALGLLIVLGAVFVLGLIVESRLQLWVFGVFEGLLRRIPLISNVYDLSKRFVSVVDRGGGDEVKNMSPVWCFFGGDGGAAVLPPLPSPQPLMAGPQEYLAILVPFAPVPFGGSLIYVPAEWLKPAKGGIENLMTVYVSMGVKSPESIRSDPGSHNTNPASN